MNAIRIDTTVDEALARQLPGLRPLVGRRVELIALDVEPAPARGPRLTLAEFLASRLARPEGVAPVTLADMRRARGRGDPAEPDGGGGPEGGA